LMHATKILDKTNCICETKKKIITFKGHFKLTQKKIKDRHMT
jgi:hypothetical protein